jgi:hypothetical protein
MKKKLDNLETMSESEVRGLSLEFARKLEEWEVMKHFQHDSTGDKLKTDENVTSVVKDEDYQVDECIKVPYKFSKYGVEIRRERRHSEGQERRHSEGRVDELINHALEEKLKDNVHVRSSSVPSLMSHGDMDRQLVDESTSIDLQLTTVIPDRTDQYKENLISEIEKQQNYIDSLNEEVKQLSKIITEMNEEHIKIRDMHKKEILTKFTSEYTDSFEVLTEIHNLKEFIDVSLNSEEDDDQNKELIMFDTEDNSCIDGYSENKIIDAAPDLNQPILLDEKKNVLSTDLLTELEKLALSQIKNEILLEANNQLYDFEQNKSHNRAMHRSHTFAGYDYIRKKDKVCYIPLYYILLTVN